MEDTVNRSQVERMYEVDDGVDVNEGTKPRSEVSS